MSLPRRLSVYFTAPGIAELTESEHEELLPDSVLVRNMVSAISSGTERATLIDLPNLGDQHQPSGKFPRRVGYSGVGIVEAVGDKVRNVGVGDRVLTHWGSWHSNFNYLAEENLTKIDRDGLPAEHAVFAIIAGFSLNALRKTRMVMGESAAVVGLGVLGLLGVAQCCIGGASPVIAVDFNDKRRALARSLGAHHVFDPSDAEYISNIKNATRGGANVVLEVTGVSAGLKTALAFTARFGRVALLGCTRVSENTIDFYQDVHRHGIELLGAHTDARARFESSPHAWTWRDDARALLDFMADGRLDIAKIVSDIFSPHEAPEVYGRLASDPANFPVGAVFDWRKL